MTAILPFLALMLIVARAFEKKDLTTRAEPTKPRSPQEQAEAHKQAAAQAAATPKIVPTSATIAVPIQPPPWPQVVPAGLPAFPGAGWVPDDPPGPGVVARASALLSTLWKHGAGTFKTEQTSGRWITYRATPMGEKKGVVAFKLAADVPTDILPRAVQPAKTSPAASPSGPSPISVSPTSPLSLPTLRQGSRGKDVITLQTRLGIGADGIFGPATKAAVVTYQRAHGLTPDGIVGRQTWGALFGQAA